MPLGVAVLRRHHRPPREPGRAERQDVRRVGEAQDRVGPAGADRPPEHADPAEIPGQALDPAARDGRHGERDVPDRGIQGIEGRRGRRRRASGASPPTPARPGVRERRHDALGAPGAERGHDQGQPHRARSASALEWGYWRASAAQDRGSTAPGRPTIHRAASHRSSTTCATPADAVDGGGPARFDPDALRPAAGGQLHVAELIPHDVGARQGQAKLRRRPPDQPGLGLATVADGRIGGPGALRGVVRAVVHAVHRPPAQSGQAVEELPVNLGQLSLGQAPPRDHRLIRDHHHLEAAVLQQSQRGRDLRQDLQLIGAAEVADVADQRAVAIDEDRPLAARRLPRLPVDGAR